MSRPPKPVALVSMPTLTASLPSFQLGLLKPTLERAGIAVQTFSLYLYFGRHVGWRLNDALSAVRPCLAGEWIWARAAFGDFAGDDAYLDHYRHSLEDLCRAAGCTVADLLAVRDERTVSFLDFCLERIDWRRFELIGFTVVFQQMAASLALARRLKERHPEIPIVFGGATFEDDIGEAILRGCPWVDHVHCGDADATFPQLIERLRSGAELDGLPGVMWRDGDGGIRFAGRAPNHLDMSTTPIPDFDEYFYARRESGYAAWPEAEEPLLPIETARGCWWGEKAHCTFCGLNRAGMTFRAKPVEQVLEMLEALSRRYGVYHFDAIDNIMATDYVDQLFGRLAQSHTDLKVHYEIRPYLTRRQLRDLRRGGLFSVQPGIESLSTHVLKLMRKHSTGVRNLSFMKWCTYYGINNLYNILMGFPGETEEDYRLQCEVIAKVPHLQPPWGIARVRADRGSPMFTEPETQAISRLYPSYAYRFIYPPERFDLERVSYYFDHDQERVLGEEGYREIHRRVKEWQARWRERPRPSLTYRKAWRSIRVDDRRNGAARTFTLGERAARLYEQLSEPRSARALAAAWDDAGWLEETLERLIAEDLVVHLDGRYLALALPANAHL
ncbi:MAG: RiPP maturation radical SAM protein 1 [Acidobacteria bacterium]|nr:MAG: RiPP maturation radical SAM protein 1 [Acidobacteriota bacterium]